MWYTQLVSITARQYLQKTLKMGI